MPKLIRLYIVNVAIGFALSVVFFGLVLWLDLAGIRHLVFRSDMGWLAAIMMIMMNGVVFAGVQFAIAVMRLAESPEGPKGGSRAPNVTRQLAPVRIASKDAAKVAGPQRP